MKFFMQLDSVEFQGIPRDFETGTATLQDRQNAAQRSGPFL